MATGTIVATLILLLGASPGMAADAPATTPEAVMARWLGTWEGTSSGSELDVVPHFRRFVGTYTAEWVLGKKFVQGRAVGAAGKPVNVWMMTYYLGTQDYRMWFFASDRPREHVERDLGRCHADDDLDLSRLGSRDECHGQDAVPRRRQAGMAHGHEGQGRRGEGHRDGTLTRKK